jgi:2-polyprenyl-3-methyl-5-hydroxy-6-metoxy-1,4-benzoquinol methylase
MRAADLVRRSLAWPRNQVRERRERSVKNIARKNTIAAFDEIYTAGDLYAEYLGPERLAFYDEVAEACARFEPRRVIDVGCGTGHLLAALLLLRPEIEVVVGVDLAEAAIRRLHEVVPDARGYVASVYDLDLGGEQFDLVLATEVLEHLDRPGEALEALRTLCAAGGRLVVTVPDGARDDWEGHVNFWAADEFREFLSVAGSARVDRTRGGDLLGVVDV